MDSLISCSLVRGFLKSLHPFASLFSADIQLNLITGDFEEHFLCLPEIGMKLRVAPGSLVALPSAYIDHFVSEFSGRDRFSVLFITPRSCIQHQNVFPLGSIEI